MWFFVFIYIWILKSWYMYLIYVDFVNGVEIDLMIMEDLIEFLRSYIGLKGVGGNFLQRLEKKLKMIDFYLVYVKVGYKVVLIFNEKLVLIFLVWFYKQ